MTDWQIEICKEHEKNDCTGCPFKYGEHPKKCIKNSEYKNGKWELKKND